jgi:hypothetical protein
MPKGAIEPMNKAQDRLEAAFDKLDSIGFPFDQDLEWHWTKAAERFTSPTLWKVFGLAQILEKEQPLTVRGAFYRAVSNGLYPDTGDSHYHSCGRLILEMRRAGFIPYSYISDSTRRRLKPSSWSGLADFAETVAQAYRKDLWERQSDYIEFFVEKDTMAGVIQPITDKFDVHLNVIRGNCSETFVYNVAEQWRRISKPIFAYYLGDHDPSGLKIEADLLRRLEGFSEKLFYWERLAVTTEDFNDPDYLGFPVKKKADPGAWKPYLDKYGDRCVEVDAIPAPIIRDRIEQTILDHVDEREWEFLQAQEAREKEDVFAIVKQIGGEAA